MIATWPKTPFTYVARKAWPQYELETRDVVSRGQQTKYQAIFSKGEFLRFAGNKYFLYPHQDIFNKIDPIMAKYGATSPVRTKRSNMTMVFGQNKKAWVEANRMKRDGSESIVASQIRVNYVWDKFDPGDNKMVQFGVSWANGIDGDLAFSITPYSHRQWCDNGMMHLASVSEISQELVGNLVKIKSDMIDGHIAKLTTESKDFDEAMSGLKKLRIIHKKKLPVEVIAQHIKGMKYSIDSLKQRYREMLELQVSAEQAQKLAQRMPTTMTKEFNWLEVENVRDKKTDQIIGRTGKLKGKPSQWKAFNDITNELSHNTARTFGRTATMYQRLDKILVRSVK